MIRSRTCRRYASGLSPLNLAVPIRLYIVAARSPPSSDPANNQFLWPKAIAPVEPLWTALGMSRRTQALGVHVHCPLGNVLNLHAQQIRLRIFFYELCECDIGPVGHRETTGSD